MVLIVDIHRFVNNFTTFFYLCTPDSPPADPMCPFSLDNCYASVCRLFFGIRGVFRQAKSPLGPCPPKMKKRGQWVTSLTHCTVPRAPAYFSRQLIVVCVFLSLFLLGEGSGRCLQSGAATSHLMKNWVTAARGYFHYSQHSPSSSHMLPPTGWLLFTVVFVFHYPGYGGSILRPLSAVAASKISRRPFRWSLPPTVTPGGCS